MFSWIELFDWNWIDKFNWNQGVRWKENYYNSKYIDAEETDLSRNQKVLGRYRLGIVIV